MKRLFLLCFVCVLLLCSCAKGHTFVRSEDGYTDQKTEITYRSLDAVYEPAKGGEAVGVYEHKSSGVTREFREIPDLDPKMFLTDDTLNVYYAGSAFVTADAWEVSVILVCEEDAISVERARFSAGTDDAVIERLRTLWFAEGDGTVLPTNAPKVSYRLKISGTLYPNLLYSFSFLYYESGEAYFYNPIDRHTVAVPQDLIDLLYPTVSGGEEG